MSHPPPFDDPVKMLDMDAGDWLDWHFKAENAPAMRASDKTRLRNCLRWWNIDVRQLAEIENGRNYYRIPNMGKTSWALVRPWLQADGVLEAAKLPRPPKPDPEADAVAAALDDLPQWMANEYAGCHGYEVIAVEAHRVPQPHRRFTLRSLDDPTQLVELVLDRRDLERDGGADAAFLRVLKYWCLMAKNP